MATLILQSGPDAGRQWLLSPPVTTIGRSLDNDIVLLDAACSRFHAECVQRGGHWRLTDKGSTHGSYINEARVTESAPLAEGDRLRVGSTELTFSMAHDDNERLAADAGTETIAFSIAADEGAGHPLLDEKQGAVLNRVAEAIQSIFDLDTLLETLMDLLVDIFQAERGMILMRESDEEGAALRPHVRHPAEEPFRVSRTVLRHALSERMAVLIADVRADERFSGAESIVSQSILSAICAPLINRDRVLGMIYLDARSHRITYEQEHLALLNIIAANAAIAIENARLVEARVEAERLAAVGVAVAGISHFVKNILTGQRAASGLIEKGLQRENLDTIRTSWPILKRANGRIATLVQDMLSYSKKREPDWQPGNLNDVAREVHANQAPRAEEQDIALALELDEALPDGEFDHQAIYDTVLNLAGNAVEACEAIPGARVTLRTGQVHRGRELFIEVVDNGCGIPDEVLRHIFEPFYSTKGSKGTGLGLAVAQKTCEEHGGRLEVESAEGEGTRFRVVLPAQRPDTSGDIEA